jgi:wobble nucleotide-excising tRNase
MIRSLEVSPAFRGLAPRPFASIGDCVLGRFTLIFGRNGSGKTTLSECRTVDCAGSRKAHDEIVRAEHEPGDEDRCHGTSLHYFPGWVRLR